MGALNMFYVYSIIGWVLETVYALAIYGRYSSRKCFLMVPMCPVYGVGAMFIVYVLTPLRHSLVLVFLGGALLATCAEYLAHVFYEGVYHLSFWNYSDHRFQLHGRVCLLYTLMWGGLSIPLVLWIGPAVSALIALLPPWATLVVTALTLADALASLYVTRTLRPDAMPGLSALLAARQR